MTGPVGAPVLPRPFRKAFELINGPLYSVEERIRQQAREFDPAVEGYVAYALESNGKRLRPALALLSGGATGNISNAHLDLAVVLEMIHAATLVHDDIIDGADKRRGQPTATAKWGNTISVLLGDCLFAHALKLSTGFANSEVSRRIAIAASDVCSGEILQTQRRFDLKLSVSEYRRMIEMKTASLFAAASELGAFLNDAPPETIAAMKHFGLRLGAAYQIYDDCLDLVGEEAEVGKTLGSDLRKGKLTLPLLFLLQGGDDAARARHSEAILRGSDDDIRAISEALDREGAIRRAARSAREQLAEAREHLDLAGKNRFRSALADVCGMLDDVIAKYA